MGIKDFLTLRGVTWVCPSSGDDSVFGRCEKNLEPELKKLSEEVKRVGGMFTYEERDDHFEFSFWSPIS